MFQRGRPRLGERILVRVSVAFNLLLPPKFIALIEFEYTSAKNISTTLEYHNLVRTIEKWQSYIVEFEGQIGARPSQYGR